jgi:prepilin-type N-terminal cleavage/methylation domain-containing protein
LRGASHRGDRGFTLIEIMIAVAILGVLASIALPVFLRYVYRSQQAERDMLVGNIEQAVMSYFGEHGRFPGIMGPASSGISAPWNPQGYVPPAIPSPAKKTWSSNLGGWADIIDVGGQVRYHYAVWGMHNAGLAWFNVYAHGDLDSDGQTDIRMRTWQIGGTCTPVATTIAGPCRDWTLVGNVMDLQEY